MGAGEYSHTSGIYECAALMVGFLKKFTPMKGDIWFIPAPIMDTIRKFYLHLGYKMAIFLQNYPIFDHYGWDFYKFCTNTCNRSFFANGNIGNVEHF